MAEFPPEKRVRFRAFSRQVEGEEAVIGIAETGVFLALPVEALELLDRLAAGLTVGEAQEEHRRKTGETPDLESLLEYLEERGFLAEDGPGAEAPAAGSAAARPRPRPTSFHFAGFPQGLARFLFGPPGLSAALALILLALAAAIAEPALRPSWRALFFTEHVTLMTGLLMASGLVITFLHEMGHLIAARARGVSCTIGLGNRFWVLVAETDMTGVWALPRKERYLPILGGPLVDAVSAAVCVLALFAQLHGVIALPPLVARFVQALGTVYLLKILWQCYFFVRTDFYYVYTMSFGCRNLMQDTQDYLRNRWADLRHRPRPVDQSHIAPREMKAIRAYSGFWLAGRIFAFAIFFLVILPVLAGYLGAIAGTLIAPGRASSYELFDAGAFGLLSLGFLLLGMGFWLKEIYQNWRWRRAMAVDDSASRF